MNKLFSSIIDKFTKFEVSNTMNKVLASKKVMVIICSLLALFALYLFLGYVLVPHPDFLEYYIPSIIEDINRDKPLEM